MATTPPADAPVLLFPDDSSWRAYLLEHHDDQAGVWLVIGRKGSDVVTLARSDALDIALCFGWIDGQARSRDDASFLQRFTPRRKRSIWSQRNREHIARLTAAGLMHPAGQAEVDRAKADGRWDAAYAPVSAREMPPDLRVALDANPAAAEVFAGLDSRNRFAVVFRVGQAKRPATRAKRIADFVDMLARGETPYPRGGSRAGSPRTGRPGAS